MNPYRKGAALLIRVFGLGLMAIGGLIMLLEFAPHHLGGREMSQRTLVLSGILCLAGLLLLFGGGALARRLTRDFDE